MDSAQKVAFVAGAFAVTAYNLRTRVIDFAFKLEGTPDRIDKVSTTARECGRKLTNLVLLFTLTAMMMGSAGFVWVGSPIAVWYCAAIFALFFASVLQFAYILFAFERLERFMLDEVGDKARKAAAAALATKE